MRHSISVSLPAEMVQEVDRVVAELDLDRSKYLRALVRNDLAKARKQRRKKGGSRG